jgi:transposase
MVTVGVDLHKRMSQIAVLSDQGKVTQRRLANDATRIGQFFHELPPARVAIEASGTWWWLVDLLEGLGHQPVLSHPKQTKAIAAARLKNDRVDAERLGGAATRRPPPHGMDSAPRDPRSAGAPAAPREPGVAADPRQEWSARPARTAESPASERHALAEHRRPT